MVSFNNLHAQRRTALPRRITRLSAEPMEQGCVVLRRALGRV